MSTKVILSIIAVVVIVGGGVAYVVSNNKTKSNNTAGNTNHSQNYTNEEETTTSIAELTKKGEPRKCTFDMSENGTTSTGTAYFANQKMYGEFTITKAGQAQSSNMIVSESTQYFWDGNTKKGFKTTVQSANSSQSTQTPQQSVDPNKTFKFKCEKWSVDASKFTPPSNVTFQDLGQLMQNIPTVGQ